MRGSMRWSLLAALPSPRIGRRAVLAAALGPLSGLNANEPPRHRPLRTALPAGPIRFATLGTSLTHAALWPAAAVDRLSCNGARRVTHRRVSAPGRGSDWGLRAAEGVVADVATIEFAINDADILDGQSLSATTVQHRRLIARLRANQPGVAIALLTTNPSFGPRGWVRPRLSAYYAAYHGLAEALELGLIDLHALWQAALTPANRRRLIPDGLHPDPKAEAEIIAPGLRAVFGGLCP